ncbi:Sodium Bile acid symporter family protein [Rubinisphaera italica]|uniref:Sodium Bile acid symporter family protein n=1 Tax=Rubinisphaera italica TaxID=2527969 RepID=A0A5C5XLL2_9PLAN|nr:Sodium Bile acid symporter family protein [Rubinisphaera italica]
MMNNPTTRRWLERMLQRYLLPGIALVYIISAFYPQFGIWLRTQSFGEGGLGFGQITAVNLLLAGLLFNTGLAVPLKELLCLTRHPKLVALGLSIRITSSLLIILIAMVGGLLFSGHVWDSILLGLILIAVMPVANSSAGWTHHSDANVGLSMWLILSSVLLSPLLVPGLLDLSSQFVSAEIVKDYQQLAGGYAGSFVMMWVIIPAVLGVLFRTLFIKEYGPRLKLTVKVMTSLFLLILNYINGSVSLPGLLNGGQNGLILLVGFSASLSCGLLFAAAWMVSVICQLAKRDRLAVMYSTAMSNTGVALVLATTVAPELVVVHLMVIFYTLIQHIIAGVIDELVVSSSKSQSHSLDKPCTITNQPVLNDLEERPTTQTGSQAATYDGEVITSKGST